MTPTSKPGKLLLPPMGETLGMMRKEKSSSSMGGGESLRGFDIGIVLGT